MKRHRIAAEPKLVPGFVGDVMTKDVYAVAAETSLETASRLLTSKHITGAPVIAEDGRPIGVVTLSDLADPDLQRSDRDGDSLYYKLEAGEPLRSGERGEVGAGSSAGGGCVADVMSPFVLSIHVEAGLVSAARIMLDDQVHRLLVVDDGKLVGIVTAVDLLRGFVEG